MKVFYQNAEIGIMKDDVTIGEMFKTNLDFYKKHIVAGKINNEIKSLDTKVNDGDKIDLIDITDKDGMKIYIRGLLFVMGMAFNELYPESYLNVNFQLSNSMFCQIDNMDVTEEMIDEVKEKMQELINADLKIRKVVFIKKKKLLEVSYRLITKIKKMFHYIFAMIIIIIFMELCQALQVF